MGRTGRKPIQSTRVVTRINPGHAGLSALACMASKPEVLRAIEVNRANQRCRAANQRPSQATRATAYSEAPKDDIQLAIKASLATAEAEMMVEEEFRKAIELSKAKDAAFTDISQSSCDGAVAMSELECPELLEKVQRAIVASRTDPQLARIDALEEEELAKALTLSAETYQQNVRALGCNSSQPSEISSTTVRGTGFLAGDTAASSDVPMAKTVAAGLTTCRYWQEKHADGPPLTVLGCEPLLGSGFMGGTVCAVDTPDDLSKWWLEDDLTQSVDVPLKGSQTCDDILQPNLGALEEGSDNEEEDEAWTLV